jgi:hypothetical protein
MTKHATYMLRMYTWHLRRLCQAVLRSAEIVNVACAILRLCYTCKMQGAIALAPTSCPLANGVGHVTT